MSIYEQITNPGILVLGGIIILMMMGTHILKNMEDPKKSKHK